MNQRIKMGKVSGKIRSRDEVIQLLRKHSGRRELFAVYKLRDAYLFINQHDGPVLYDHALMNGHTDPDFLGFYGRFGGWKYFSEDTAVEVAA